jgi:hypothetical protein
MLKLALRVLATVVLALVIAGASQATPILVTLAEESNDPGKVAASELNATFLFTVVGTTLTIDVTNTTDALSLQNYDISAFDFNISTEIVALTLTSAPSSDAGWIQGTTVAGGFMPFDDGASALPDQTNNEIGQNPDLINAGASGAFTFSFVCGGACDETDFVLPNGNGYTLAAKFINGDGQPSGDSGWGATTFVPEPSTGLLLLIGLAGLAGRRHLRA